MADDDIDIYGDDFEFENAGIPADVRSAFPSSAVILLTYGPPQQANAADSNMNEYDTDVKTEPNSSIQTHTTRAQEVVGTKRAREEEPEDRKPPTAGNGPNLPAKPNEVRGPHFHVSGSVSLLASAFVSLLVSERLSCNHNICDDVDVRVRHMAPCNLLLWWWYCSSMVDHHVFRPLVVVACHLRCRLSFLSLLHLPCHLALSVTGCRIRYVRMERPYSRLCPLPLPQHQQRRRTRTAPMPSTLET